MPYYIDSEVKLSQTLAIIRYLGRKYDLNGGSPEEKLNISLMEQQVADLNNAFFALADDPNCDKLKPDYIAGLPSQIQLLSDYLGEQPFVAGAAISYVDFWLYEYLVKIKVLVPQVFAQFDNLKRFVDRIESLPRLKSYIKKLGPMPFCRPSCKWNAVY